MKIKKIEADEPALKRIEVGGEPTLAEIYEFLSKEVRGFKLVIFTSDAPCYVSEIELNYEDKTVTLR
jgi:hypothetical protein